MSSPWVLPARLLISKKRATRITRITSLEEVLAAVPPLSLPVKLSLIHILEAVADGISAAADYLKETPSANPNKLTIKGAQSEIDQIARCVVIYEGTAVLDDTLTAKGRLVLYDENGNELTLKHITYSDTDFTITVPIYLQKDFPVTVSYINTNGLDTSKFNLELSQNTVTIAGPKDCLLYTSGC